MPAMIAGLDPEIARPKLAAMLRDPDARVVARVVAALATVKPPDIDATLRRALTHEDVIVRATAATAIGELRIAGAEQALSEAYRAGWRDAGYQARAAALGALAAYGAPAAMGLLKEALGDKDWAVRVRAAALIKTFDPAFDAAHAMRPAPARAPAPYDDPAVVAPSTSPHVFLDTARGTIEIELGVIESPLTAENFLGLSREGFFAGLAIHRVVPDFVVQDGDNRGDGEGGPGYTIRDEINRVPYLRGTVGMALDWADTGGSQFFITVSPQPHLDGRYTAFGRVVAGLDVVDRLQQGDVIRRVRTWDGVVFTER
jgi:cyclophilin family peptidyl-prolyl cis-trans isomerase